MRLRLAILAMKSHFARMQNDTENRQYCRKMVAESDRERYLWSLFAAADRQPAVWAVWAFNQEIAKIWDTVSEPALADIRLQWWHEVLDEITAGNIRQQPVIEELAVIENKDVVFPLLKQAIEARKAELFTGGSDISGLKEYATGAGGALHRAVCLVENPGASGEAQQVAALIGEAWAMLGLVRALPYYWQHNKDLGSETLGKITSLPKPEEALEHLQPLIFAMKSFAEERLAEASALKKGLSRRERLSFLPACLIKLHLVALTKADNNPFELPRYENSDFKKMRKLLWASLFR